MAAAIQFPDAPTPWTDLSTGVNPSPYPRSAEPRDARTRLPDPAQTARLEAAAAAAFGLAAVGSTMAVPGSEPALRILARLLPAKTVAIAGPTYGSHAQAWRAAGASVQTFDPDQLGSADADVVIIVNPNNPDGRLHTPEALTRIALRQAARGGWLIVDEAFAETTPASSVAAKAGDVAGGRLIVLRSFGKFYGLPGVRLGFVLAQTGVLAALRTVFGDWPVSSAAIAAGLAAYPDEAWRARTLARLARKAARLDTLLSGAGFDIVGGTCLFRLCSADDAPRRFRVLAERGVLTRPFEANPRWLRFGLPGSAVAWTRLERALELCL
jgi:cobalamin biosynthetic protein CobC